MIQTMSKNIAAWIPIGAKPLAVVTAVALLAVAIGVPSTSNFISCQAIRRDAMTGSSLEPSPLYGVYWQSPQHQTDLLITNTGNQASGGYLTFFASSGRPISTCVFEVGANDQLRYSTAGDSLLETTGESPSGLVRIYRESSKLQTRMQQYKFSPGAPHSESGVFSQQMTPVQTSTTYATFSNLTASGTNTEQVTLLIANTKPATIQEFKLIYLDRNGNTLSEDAVEVRYPSVQISPITQSQRRRITAVTVVPGATRTNSEFDPWLQTGSEMNYALLSSSSGTELSPPIAEEVGPPEYTAHILRENAPNQPVFATLQSLSRGLYGKVTVPTLGTSFGSNIHRTLELFNTIRTASVAAELYSVSGERIPQTQQNFLCDRAFNDDGTLLLPSRSSTSCIVETDEPLGQIKLRVTGTRTTYGILGQLAYYALADANDPGSQVTSLAHSKLRKYRSNKAFQIVTPQNLQGIQLSNTLPFQASYNVGVTPELDSFTFPGSGSRLFLFGSPPLSNEGGLPVPTGVMGEGFLIKDDHGLVDLLDVYEPFSYPSGSIRVNDDDLLDVNGDGRLNEEDYLFLEGAIEAQLTPDIDELRRADTNGDGAIDETDLEQYVKLLAENDGSKNTGDSQGSGNQLERIDFSLGAKVTTSTPILLVVRESYTDGSSKDLRLADVIEKYEVRLNGEKLELDADGYFTTSDVPQQDTLSLTHIETGLSANQTLEVLDFNELYSDIGSSSDLLDFQVETTQDQVSRGCIHPAEYFTIYPSSGTGQKHIVRRPITAHQSYDRVVTDTLWDVPLPIIPATAKLPRLAAAGWYDSQISNSGDTLWLAMTFRPVASIRENYSIYTEYYTYGLGAETWGTFSPNPELGTLNASTTFCGFVQIDISDPDTPQLKGQYIIPGCGDLSFDDSSTVRPYGTIAFGSGSTLSSGSVFGGVKGYFYVDDDNVFALGSRSSKIQDTQCQNGVLYGQPTYGPCYKYERVAYTLDSTSPTWKEHVWPIGIDETSSRNQDFFLPKDQNLWQIVSIDRDSFPYVMMVKESGTAINETTQPQEGNCDDALSEYTFEYAVGKITPSGLSVAEEIKTFHYEAEPYESFKCYQEIRSKQTDDVSQSLACTLCGCPLYSQVNEVTKQEHRSYDKLPSLRQYFSFDVYSGPSIPSVFGYHSFDKIKDSKGYVFAQTPSFSVSTEPTYQNESCGGSSGFSKKKLTHVKVTLFINEEEYDGEKEIICEGNVGSPLYCNGIDKGDFSNDFSYYDPIQRAIFKAIELVPTLKYISTPVNGKKVHAPSSEAFQLSRIIPLSNSGHHVGLRKEPGSDRDMLLMIDGNGNLSDGFVYSKIGPSHKIRVYGVGSSSIASSDIAFKNSDSFNLSTSPVHTYSIYGYQTTNSPDNYLCGLVTDFDETFRAPFSSEYKLNSTTSWAMNTSLDPYWSRNCPSGFGGSLDVEIYKLAIDRGYGMFISGSTTKHHNYLQGACNGETCER